MSKREFMKLLDHEYRRLGLKLKTEAKLALDRLSTDCVNELCTLDMKYTLVTEDFDRMLGKLQKLDEEAHRQLNGREAIDEAIAIIVEAMNAVEAEREENKTWYLPYMKLERVFQRLCNEKYFPEWEAK